MRHTFRATIGFAGHGGQVVELEADEAHHLRRVARRGVGETIELIDPDGLIWPAVILGVDDGVSVRLGDVPRAGPPVVDVDLAVGAMEWGRFDLLVEKCTEIGIARVTMYTSDRMGRRIDQDAFDRRRERLGRLADAAAKQSGHGRRPEIAGLVPLAAVIDRIPTGTGVVLDAHAARPLGDVLDDRPHERVALVVGPDAGLSDGERAQVAAAGLVGASLGGATLRAETAAFAAVAVAADRLAVRGR